jgi:hypothetical protein
MGQSRIGELGAKSTELLCTLKANARQAMPKLPGPIQTYVTCHGNGAKIRIKFFLEERAKGWKSLTGRANILVGIPFSECKCITGSWVKSGRKDLSNILRPGTTPDQELENCFGKAIKENHHLSTRRITKALNINSMKV